MQQSFLTLIAMLLWDFKFVERTSCCDRVLIWSDPDLSFPSLYTLHPSLKLTFLCFFSPDEGPWVLQTSPAKCLHNVLSYVSQAALRCRNQESKFVFLGNSVTKMVHHLTFELVDTCIWCVLNLCVCSITFTIAFIDALFEFNCFKYKCLKYFYSEEFSMFIFDSSCNNCSQKMFQCRKTVLIS